MYLAQAVLPYVTETAHSAASYVTLRLERIQSEQYLEPIDMPNEVRYRQDQVPFVAHELRDTTKYKLVIRQQMLEYFGHDHHIKASIGGGPTKSQIKIHELATFSVAQRKRRDERLGRYDIGNVRSFEVGLVTRVEWRDTDESYCLARGPKSSGPGNRSQVSDLMPH
jgi:hypothetical protein